MSVPDFQSFMLPMLKQSADGRERSLADFRAELAKVMAIAEEDLAERLPSGTQTRYENRVAWAAGYLHRAGCLERIRRGVFRITERGREILAEKPQKVTIKLLSRFAEFRAFYQAKASGDGTPPPAPPGTGETEETQTPEEILESTYQSLLNSLASDVLEVVKRMSPTACEKLVVKLLVAMGYGGSIEDAGRAVGKSGDEGIDGIIKEDKLGLDSVYIQAKKW